MAAVSHILMGNHRFHVRSHVLGRLTQSKSLFPSSPAWNRLINIMVGASGSWAKGGHTVGLEML